MFRRLFAIAVVTVACLALSARPARASAYAEAQARALEAAAAHEVKDHDGEGESAFLELARRARAQGGVTVADLPLRWQTGVRNGRRDTQENEDAVRLRRIERRLAELSPAVRDRNAELVAHATVDAFIARRELSEPIAWHTCAFKALRCAEADLDKLVLDGDRDGDGILDSVDRCPDQPEDKDGFQDADGCPDPDNDGDGILDGDDRCPNEAEDKDGFEDRDGCPDPDNDGDGIPDVRDACPNVAETVNGIEDQDGCPDDFGNVYFASDSARLDAAAIDVMVKNAQILKSAPKLVVRLVGHADAQAGEDYNLRLARKRAEAVRDYFVTYLEIPEGRVRIESAGEGEPAADNATAEGRRLNRRVEVRLTETN